MELQYPPLIASRFVIKENLVVLFDIYVLVRVSLFPKFCSANAGMHVAETKTRHHANL
jgi:hypothetical protein